MDDRRLVRVVGICAGLVAAAFALDGCSSIAPAQSPPDADGGQPGVGGLLAGTGGAPGTGGAGGGYAGKLKPVVDAYCAAARSCCGKAGFPADGLADCENVVPNQVYSVSLADSGAVAVDDAALQKCAAAYKDAATTCTINDVLDACRHVYSGTKGQGQPCQAALECRQDQGPMVCFIFNADGVSDAGTCQPVPHGKAGDECSDTC